ncbi:hypothetical protein P43SY_007633 [Pythium insidiosum]|uniref:Lipoyl-binding domain-containing protein n=1 Tax=Pythium insidiosum TaxID=114742 RepID=A0AAD5LGN9_PYTIN|nr:hypothetical protein P43SY_007633 [Pythium insidiosum]
MLLRLALRRCSIAPTRLAVRRLSTAGSAAAAGGSDAGDADKSVLPPHTKFRMPDLDFENVSGGSSSTVTLSKWHLKEGAKIVDGAHMCEIDTPDLVFVLDSGDEGYLARILVPEGTENVPPNQPLAIIVPTHEDIEPFVDALQRHPTAIEGYVEPSAAEQKAIADTAADDATSSADSTDSSDAADVLRYLQKLQKEGHFADEQVFKVLKKLARKNDKQLLITFKGSFSREIPRDEASFDANFFVETATELAEEALEQPSN